MKLVLGIVLLCCAGLGGGRARAQGTVGSGTFQNFNFEAATIPSGTTIGTFPTSEALPGWTAYLGDSLQSTIGYNDYPINGDSIALVGSRA
jgi:hypothetical protein